jgi:hypothetical protein
MDHGQQEGSSVQTQKSGGDSERSVTFRSEGTVSDLGGLEGDNHVGGRSKHGQVSGDGGRERHLEPVVGAGVREGGSKHLAHRNVGSDVGKNGDDHDEPVHARNRGHLLGAPAHGQAEESLGDTSIIERSDKKELSNEKHEKTVIDFGKGGL